MANKAIEDQVAQSRLTASQQLGVDSTPTFFINGKKYDGGPTFERVRPRCSTGPGRGQNREARAPGPDRRCR